jgi:hypothetical protein
MPAAATTVSASFANVGMSVLVADSHTSSRSHARRSHQLVRLPVQRRALAAAVLLGSLSVDAGRDGP